MNSCHMQNETKTNVSFSDQGRKTANIDDGERISGCIDLAKVFLILQNGRKHGTIQNMSLKHMKYLFLSFLIIFIVNCRITNDLF